MQMYSATSNCNKIPIPIFSLLLELASDDILHQPMPESESDGSTLKDSRRATPKTKPFTQSQFNNLVRYLALSKEVARILVSRPSEHRQERWQGGVQGVCLVPGSDFGKRRDQC